MYNYIYIYIYTQARTRDDKIRVMGQFGQAEQSKQQAN